MCTYMKGSLDTKCAILQDLGYACISESVSEHVEIGIIEPAFLRMFLSMLKSGQTNAIASCLSLMHLKGGSLDTRVAFHKELLVLLKAALRFLSVAVLSWYAKAKALVRKSQKHLFAISICMLLDTHTKTVNTCYNHCGQKYLILL